MTITKKKNNHYRAVVDYPIRLTSYGAGSDEQTNYGDEQVIKAIFTMTSALMLAGGKKSREIIIKK